MEISRPKSKQPIPEHAKLVFKGVIFDVYQWKQELFDGTKATFEKIKRPDTVVVFPVFEDGTIMLAEQEQSGKEPFISAFGGRVEEGEGILVAAQREFLEESGYQAEEYVLWDARHPFSKIDWVVYTFIVKGLRKVADPKLDGGEKITLKYVTFEEFLDMGTNQKFSEKEVVFKLLEAKLNPEKKEALKKLFNPSILI